MNIKNPDITKVTKVINKSEPYGIPPIVVPASMDPVLKNNLRDLLLNIHETDKGQVILSKLMIEKFIVLEDQRYDSIRKMRKLFEK
jgi:phosphonate transport system substrate-binding protein